MLNNHIQCGYNADLNSSHNLLYMLIQLLSISHISLGSLGFRFFFVKLANLYLELDQVKSVLRSECQRETFSWHDAFLVIQQPIA